MKKLRFLAALLAAVCIIGACGSKSDADSAEGQRSAVLKSDNNENEERSSSDKEAASPDKHAGDESEGRTEGTEDSTAEERTDSEQTVEVQTENVTEEAGNAEPPSGNAATQPSGSEAVQPSGNETVQPSGNAGMRPPEGETAKRPEDTTIKNAGNTTGKIPEQQNTKPHVTIEEPSAEDKKVGASEGKLTESLNSAQADNHTEYTETSHNSGGKRIYVSSDSVNYPYALAFVKGDISKLNDEQKQIFAVIEPLLNDIVSRYATDYEREKAVHDYIVLNCTYNIDGCNSNTLQTYDFHPYGVFVKRSAVCQGYAEAFKLCMDLIGIRCDIVTGRGNGEPHAWNAVCLDGEWYQTDCTWDDPLPDEGGVYYNYFNVTDARMRKDHTYSYANACNGIKYCYVDMLNNDYRSKPNYVATPEAFYSYVSAQVADAVAAGAGSPITITAYIGCTADTYRNYGDLSRIDFSPLPYSSQIGMSIGQVTDEVFEATITITRTN